MSVAKKIKKVMEKVQYLQKDGEVSYGRTNYAYLSEEKITSELNKAFREVGLIIYPTKMEVVNNENNIAQIIATYRIQDTEGEDYIEVQTIGEGQDKGDKKMNKAMTAAFKYAQRQSFMIPTGDDPDHVSTPELNADSTNKKGESNDSVNYLKQIRKLYGQHQSIVEPLLTDYLDNRGYDPSNLGNMKKLSDKQAENLLDKIKKEV